MAINVVSVQYNAGLLPDTILLNHCYYHRGRTRLNAMKRFCICSLCFHLNVLAFFLLTGGCSEGLDAFRFLFKRYNIYIGFYIHLTSVHVEPAQPTPNTVPPLPCETHPAQRLSIRRNGTIDDASG